ncbi:MAG: alkaline phosphatase D family protein [Actinomycetes bacterium]
MPHLVVGPMLRYVDTGSATVWVETDTPCEVEVLGTSTRTLTVHGHHYGLVVLDGLEPGASVPYTVSLDGVPVWPEPGAGPGDSPPRSRIRTPSEGSGLRLLFGSCRTSVPHTPEEWRVHGVDALRAYARRMAAAPDDAEWPDALLLLGDQVYADETSERVREVMQARRDTEKPPGTEVADFEEYAALYRLAWSDPEVRWLLSTVPTAMVFDDHDIRDDWNTSETWRAQMAAHPWWSVRIRGGLGAYWLYQHLGNLAPEDLAQDRVLASLRRCADEGRDGGAVLDAFAAEADRDPAAYRWSFVRDFGRTRLVVVDTRCGRMLDEGNRLIVDADEWSWVEEKAEADVDHLLVGTSLPYLLPRGIHHIEGWNEAVCAGAWGRRAARVGERIRQGVDLEHWAAFRRSFDAMSRLLRRVATRPGAPASVVVMSGDVHYSYLARVRLPGAPSGASAVVQAVCSPVRNPLSRKMRYANAVAQVALARVVGRALAGAAGLRRPELDWSMEGGPWFDNALATIVVDGRTARLRWERAVLRDGVESVLAVSDLSVTRG